MQIFGVFVLWKLTTPESTRCPTPQEVALYNENSPQVLREWKAARDALVDKVNVSDAYLFYNRLDMENGDVLTMTYYSTEADFNKLRSDNQAEFDAVDASRADLAAYLGLEVVVKSTMFDLDQFNYDDPVAALAFFDSIQ